jgi:hypothetical protein
MIHNEGAEPVDNDPATLIALIYRIVDAPHRAFNLTAILVPILAALIQITAPKATVAGLPAPTIWWSGAGVVEIGWILFSLWLRCRVNKTLPPTARQLLSSTEPSSHMSQQPQIVDKASMNTRA